VPRNRTARQAVLGVSVRRPAAGQLPSRSTTALRRRLVVGVLVLLALALITLSYRQDGGGRLSSAENAAAAVLRPFQVAAERVAQPFRDVASWFDGLFDARSDAERLQAENERLRQQLVQNQSAARENATLRSLLDYQTGPSYPKDFDGLTAAVISQPAGAFAQAVVVAVGAKDGVEPSAPVVTGDGLIGLVTRVGTRTSRVTLLTDEQSAVSALDVKSGASGIVRHGRGGRSTLVLDLVPKEEEVRVGDTIVTSGWRSNRLSSLYPPHIPIGTVTSVGQTDTDLYKQVQVAPFADFTSIDAVIVLVRKDVENAP
jgi:rod shape-determining protein MreC